MLLHKNPKTEAHIKENIVHLQKQKRDTQKQLDFHKEKADYAKHGYEKVLPAFKRAGYTVNHDINMREEKAKEKLHLQQATVHERQMHSIQQHINTHKNKLKTLNKPTPRATPTTPMHLALSSFHVPKDGRYYERLGKLFHISIDTDAKNSIKNHTGTPAEKKAAYLTAYTGHKYYAKMNGYFKKAAAKMALETTANVVDQANEDLNLMHSIYQDCIIDLNSNARPATEVSINQAIKLHPSIAKLNHLLPKSI